MSSLQHNSISTGPRFPRVLISVVSTRKSVAHQLRPEGFGARSDELLFPVQVHRAMAEEEGPQARRTERGGDRVSPDPGRASALGRPV